MAVPVTNGLVEYGILNEQSDVRVHVSVPDQTLYVFQTTAARAAIARLDAEGKAPLMPVFGVVDGTRTLTADGWTIPIDEVGDLRRVHLPEWEGWAKFHKDLSPTIKGTYAVDCVRYALKHGLLPLWDENAAEDDRREVQRMGVDLIVRCAIEVKCDWKVSQTGNVYLQRAERNPHRQI